MQELSFQKPMVLAIAEGATTPNPGQAGVTVWSSTLGKPVYWTGTQWTAGQAAADPWAYLQLASDFTTSSATAVDVTGLAFTPAANTDYVIEAQLLMRTATATVGARPGIAWPTAGMTDAIAEIRASSSATAQVLAYGNSAAAVLNANTGLATTTGSFAAKVEATLLMGASPAGNFRLQLASETAGTNVTLKAGSWMRYRTF